MKRLLLTLLLSVTAEIPPSLHAGVAEQAASANASLLSGHPVDALNAYRTLLASPRFAATGSPELWYNRGLAEEKTGDAAAASLSFRRALLLDPGFLPAQRQLEAVLGTLGLPVSAGWKERVQAVILTDPMIVGGAIVGWIGALLLVVLLLRGPRRKGLVVLALAALVAGHGASVFGSLIDPRRTARDQGVVTAKAGPTLRATPADSATPGGTLAPGTLIKILSRNGAWCYIAAGPGLTGWIPSDTVTFLLPPASSANGSQGS